jgi:UDP-N-acetylmuramoyl-L-alanyl-D-glutamate--2,6-diaminopimelate ligase
VKLENLFNGIPVIEKINWDPHRNIGKVTSDSRAIEPGDVFVAVPGSRMDGHDFISEAMLAQAGAVVVERPLEIFIPARVCVIRVSNSAACLSEILKRFHGNPDQRLKLVGVTGTNGKTTIAYLLHQMLREKTKTAYLGTLWYDLFGKKIPAPNTTPGSEVLIPFMKQMVDQGVEYCSMEVSSHALEQNRIYGLQFELALFTQLTQDHLDYHKSMEAYFQAKRLFFTNAPEPRQMLINKDCPYGRRLLEEKPKAKSYSLEGPADYQVIKMEPSFQGSRFTLRFKGREITFQTHLPMRHNIANLTTVLAALDLLGYDLEDFRGILAEIPGIPGRLERVSGSDSFQVFVDYAHTPDAIENVLREAKKLNPKRILTLFGCGGDRDRTKRPQMAKTACQYSDIVVLTSDNPRSEDPENILEDIKKGVPKNSNGFQIHEILDRKEGIEKIISMAEPGDAVFVLGKGHEDYQIIGDRKIPFDDRLVVQEALKRKSRVLS